MMRDEDSVVMVEEDLKNVLKLIKVRMFIILKLYERYFIYICVSVNGVFMIWV